MMRKHNPRQPKPTLPPWLRPRLTADQVRDLGLAHWINLDAIARGEGDEALLWQVVGGALTWSRVAQLLAARDATRWTPALEAMRAQLELTTALVKRFGATGRVLFTGPEYQLAKQGAELMDELAAIVDRHTAVAAADWSEARVSVMAEESASRKAA
jgi:hypothetical protein